MESRIYYPPPGTRLNFGHARFHNCRSTSNLAKKDLSRKWLF